MIGSSIPVIPAHTSHLHHAGGTLQPNKTMIKAALKREGEALGTVP